jgi:hypothetical protein
MKEALAKAHQTVISMCLYGWFTGFGNVISSGKNNVGIRLIIR